MLLENYSDLFIFVSLLPSCNHTGWFSVNHQELNDSFLQSCLQGVCETSGIRGSTRTVKACDVWPVADGAAAPFTNVASGKPAVQSSNVSNHEADRALDRTHSGPCSLTHTDSPPPHWWQVDLQNTFCVVTVTVDNTINSGKREERL